MVEPPLQQHGANAALSRQQPIERRTRRVDRSRDLVRPEPFVAKMRVDLVHRGLLLRLHMFGFIVRQLDEFYPIGASPRGEPASNCLPTCNPEIRR